jgi:hypothetical protein
MSAEIQAIVQFCQQVGPDDYEMQLRSKTFGKTATIQMIEEWAQKYGKFSILDVKFATNDKTDGGE